MEALAARIGWPGLLAMTVGLAVAYEVSYRVGRHHREELKEAKKSQAEVAVAALLALLGLLLAFSFEIGNERYEKRKEIVLREGNAIETAYLRAAMLPPPHDAHVQALLRRYVQRRVGLKTPAELERAIRDSATMHGEMWAETTVIAREHEGSPIIALFVASLNELIDLHDERVTVGLFQRMPPAVFALLYFVSVLSIGMVGLRAGLDRTRGWLAASVLIAAIMSVIGLIDSLDNPTSRWFHVNDYAIEHAQRVVSNMNAVSTSP